MPLLYPFLARGANLFGGRANRSGESHFIIRYAQTLDKGKEQGRLEGRVGDEFRLLKWEFIFLVLFSAPLSAFSRKQFVRSVLGQFSAHYISRCGS